jgi:hypothetical protein
MAHCEEYEYTDVDSIPKYAICPKCKKVFNNPVSTQCSTRPQHRFCRLCAEESINHNHSCPICNQSLHIQDLTPITDGVLIDMLDELPVKCISCQQTGLERGNFNTHKNEVCPKTSVKCSSL